jgi:hypothetical protein
MNGVRVVRKLLELGSAAAVGALVVGIFATVKPAISRAKEFRAHPTLPDLNAVLAADSPTDILTRWLVFRGGSETYRRDLHRWVYHLYDEPTDESADQPADQPEEPSSPLNDTWWNRWILEADLATLSPEERTRALLHYPISLSRAGLPMVAREIAAGNSEALIVLQRAKTEAGRTYYKQWINDNLLQREDPDLFTRVGGYLVRSSEVPAVELLSKYWPILSESQKNSVIKKIAANLTPNSKATTDFYAWYVPIVQGPEISNLEEGSAPFEAFFKSDAVKEQAGDLLAHNVTRFSPDSIAIILDFFEENNADSVGLAQELYTTGAEGHPAVAIEAFHHITHNDLPLAEKLARPVLARPDSELRKGTIVMLVRHGSLLGETHIDEAFTGSAPRTTMFHSAENYESSDTAQLYRKISGHDYEETGKTWPPTRITPGNLKDEAKQWRRFIDKYPWFPGTDDAYYRMGYSFYSAGEFGHAEETVLEYMNSSLPDNDARPFIMRLLKVLALQHPQNDSQLEENLRVLVRHPIVLVMLDEKPEFEQTVRALDWFIANPKMCEALTGDCDELKSMRSVVQSLNHARKDERLSSVFAVLGDEPILLREIITSDFFEDNENDAMLTRLATYTKQVLQRAQQKKKFDNEATAAAECALILSDTKLFDSSFEILKNIPEEQLPEKLRPAADNLRLDDLIDTH